MRRNRNNRKQLRTLPELFAAAITETPVTIRHLDGELVEDRAVIDRIDADTIRIVERKDGQEIAESTFYLRRNVEIYPE